MNFDLTKDQKDFKEAANTFAKKNIAPYATEWDEKKIFPKKIIKKAGEMGFCGLYTKESAGGLEQSRLTSAIVFEELAAACPSTAAYITIHNMVTWMIDSFAVEAVRQKYCPSMAMGEQLGSYCLTEAGAGSDAGSLKTTAIKKGANWILNGTKSFVSGGGESDILVVMARTGEAGPKGISAFIVPAKIKGLSYGSNEKKMGWNSQPTCIINFDQVVIPEDHILGQEGEGFKIAMKGLDGGRINIGICSVGAGQAALNHTQKYMQERSQFGKTLSRFQALQFKLADMATAVVTARNIIYLAAYKLDTKDFMASTYCALAKKTATDLCFDVCNQAIQVHGGYGYTSEYPVEKLMRDARVHQILEGTNEIMNVIISKSILSSDENFNKLR